MVLMILPIVLSFRSSLSNNEVIVIRHAFLSLANIQLATFFLDFIAYVEPVYEVFAID